MPWSLEKKGEESPQFQGYSPLFALNSNANRRRPEDKGKEQANRPVEAVVSQHLSPKESGIEPTDFNEMASSSASVLRFVCVHQDLEQRNWDDREVLLEDWIEAYKTSEQCRSDAIAIFEGGSWPKDFQVWQGKLIRDGRILVPERLVHRVVWAQGPRPHHFRLRLGTPT